jgi:photosynthetic reaction center M subunit
MDNENESWPNRADPCTPSFSRLIGWFGNAQLGPIYLGWTGMVSLATFILCLNIIGSTCWPQVDWNPEFLRQLFWLALEPPAPNMG